VAHAADAAIKSATTSTNSAPPSTALAKGELMDINSASKQQLSSLPKIGDARSDAIIKGRPYRGKDELLSKHILTQDVYNSIKDMVIARQNKIENTAPTDRPK
jgi:DNA uptake protein ComE-like DNA-binding protein